MTTIVLIDPLISSSYLASELAAFGLQTVAVFTGLAHQDAEYFQIPPGIFAKQLHFSRPSVDVIITALRAFDIAYVINGCEASTHYTDAIATALTPDLCNDPATTAHRTDKFAMQEALRSNGLPAIKQCRFSLHDIEQLGNVIAAHGLSFPCFAKPVNGIGTLGAFAATTLQDLQVQLRAFIASAPPLPMTEYVLQELITGQELFVDTFSQSGRHYISSVQRYHRERSGATPVLRYSEPVSDISMWQRCAEFVQATLSAVGLQNGFAHTEIFLCDDGSMRLIEVNPRVSGGRGFCNKVAAKAGFYTQLDLFRAGLHGDIQSSTPAMQREYVRRCYLFNWHARPSKDPTAYFCTLPSLYACELLKPIGYASAATRNVLEIHAFALLAHADRDVIERDSAQLFAWEESGVLL